MAISIITTPDNYEPVYTNSMPFVISSTFNTEENFKYLFDLYVRGTLQTTVAPYPRPNGQGLYSPHYVLQSFCDTELRATSSTIFSNAGSIATYSITFGENYNPGLTFGDTYLIGSYVGNKLGLEFTQNISTQLFVGDTITIEKDNISINPWISGQATILSITNSTLSGYSKTVFTSIDLQSPVFSSNESGSITNVFRYGTSSGVKFGWNAARQYDDFSDFQTDYVMSTSSPNTQFLTSYDTAYFGNLTLKKPIYSNEYETLDLITGTATFTTLSNLYARYFYYNSAGSLIGSEAINFGSTTNVFRFTIPTGTANILSQGGSGSQFLNNGTLASYIVQAGVGNGITPLPSNPISLGFVYEIIPDCRPYEVIRLAFLNKLGGYDYWSFNLVSRFTSQVKRTQIDRALRPQYSIGDRGRDVIYSEAVENWTINSDFLTDDQALFVRELVESSSVFYIDGINQLPVVITSDSWEYKSGLLDGYVQYTLTFQKAFDRIINR